VEGNRCGFVVLAEQRTGSNLFLAGLKQHPRVNSFHEALNSNFQFMEEFTSDPDERLELERIRRHQPGRFLREYLYDWERHEQSHLGFKCQYQNLRGKKTDEIVEALMSIDGLVVVHLIRENMLERLVSKLNAEITGRYWVGKGFEPPRAAPYAIGYDEALADFEAYSAEQSRVESLFVGKRLLRVTYEEIVADYQRSVSRLLENLGLDAISCEPGSVKQSIPAWEQVTNFNDLKHAFQGTSYARFFEVHEAKAVY